MENSPLPWKQEPASPPSSECDGVAASVLPPSSKFPKFSKICPVFGRNFENFTEFENVTNFGGKLENSNDFGGILENTDDFDGKIEIFTDFDGNFEDFNGKFVDFDGKLEKFVDFERKAEIASHLLMNLENLEDLDDLIKDEPFLLDEKLLGDIDAPQATPVLHPLPLSPPNTSPNTSPSYPYQNVYEIIGNLTPPQSPPQSSFLTPLQNCFQPSNTTSHQPEDDIAKELAVVDELVRSRIENMQFGTQKMPNGTQKNTQWKFDENQTKIKFDEIQKVPDGTEWKLCYSDGTQYFPEVPNETQDSSSSNEDWISKKPEYWLLEPYDNHSSSNEINDDWVPLNETNNFTQSSDDDDWIPESVAKRTQRICASYGTQNKNESSDDDCVPVFNGIQTKCVSSDDDWLPEPNGNQRVPNGTKRKHVSSDDDWVSEESNESQMKCILSPNGIHRKNESSDDDWIPETNGIKRKWIPEEPNGTQRKKRIKGNVEEKKVRKKEQNKNAATRYRMKKKAELEEIFLEEKELLERKGELMGTVGDLVREIKYLKGLMRDLFKAKGLIE